MSYYDEIRKVCKLNNGIVTASEISQRNIPSWYLTEMVKKGELFRVKRGIYCTNNGDFDDCYFFQLKNRRCIYSFTSALYIHGMTDRIPYVQEVTVYKGYNGSHLGNEVIIHYVNKDIYELGITEGKTIFGNTVKVYDVERTICDLIRKRDKIDTEVFTKAIRNYANRSDRDFKKLRRYAKKMKIQEKVDAILEII